MYLQRMILAAIDLISEDAGTTVAYESVLPHALRTIVV
jgi:hypothetical protein